MDQARVLIAIVLSFLVFFAWNFFFVEKQKPVPPKGNTAVVQEDEKENTNQEKAPVHKTAEANPPAAYMTETPVVSQKTFSRVIRVESPLYSVAINETGAAFQSFVLKNYKESTDPKSPDKELVSPAVSQNMIRLSLAGNSIPGLKDAIFSAQEAPDTLAVTDMEKELVSLR